MLKYLFFLYQKLMFYVSQFGNEYGKAGRFVNETLIITTFLAVRGVKLSFWLIIPLYILVIMIAALIGKFLTVIGVIKYNNSLGNVHNLELMEIRQDLKIIKNHLGIGEK